MKGRTIKMEKKILYIQLFAPPVISILIATYISADSANIVETIKIFFVHALLTNIGIMTGCSLCRRMECISIRYIIGIPLLFNAFCHLLFNDIMDPTLYSKERIITYFLVIFLFTWTSIILDQTIIRKIRED